MAEKKSAPASAFSTTRSRRGGEQVHVSQRIRRLVRKTPLQEKRAIKKKKQGSQNMGLARGQQGDQMGTASLRKGCKFGFNRLFPLDESGMRLKDAPNSKGKIKRMHQLRASVKKRKKAVREYRQRLNSGKKLRGKRNQIRLRGKSPPTPPHPQNPPGIAGIGTPKRNPEVR